MPENKTVKVRFLRPGMLAGPVVVVLKGPPQPGSFGKMNLNFDLDGQNFIFSINPENPQYAALVETFGPADSWEGCKVRLSDGKILKGVNVEPVE